MAFLVFMIILHLYSDHCFGQQSMGYDAAGSGMKCTKCIVGTKAPEIICSECTRGRDNADKPFTCRRCNIGVSSAQPFICRRCSNTNTNADINSCDGLTTTTAPSTGDNASREQRLAALRRFLIETRGWTADRADRWINININEEKRR